MIKNVDIDILIDKYKGRVVDLLEISSDKAYGTKPSVRLGLQFAYEIVIGDLKALLEERSFDIVENKICEEKELLHF